jgi:hypothetical protein
MFALFVSFLVDILCFLVASRGKTTRRIQKNKPFFKKEKKQTKQTKS